MVRDTMDAHSFALFDTAIGRCAVVWNARGIASVQLPQPNGEPASLARLVRRFAQASEAVPTASVQRAINDIVGLLSGQPQDLRDIALDMDGLPPFNRRVYEVARGIAPGDTLTYGEIAQRLGEPGMARAVGQALGRNPFPIVVPCHRVLAAGGGTGGFSAPGGVNTKLRLLAIEGASLNGTRSLFDDL